MKILFIPEGCLPFHASTLEERPLGGIETGVIRLASELSARGHRAIVLTAHPQNRLSEPLYLPYSALGDVGRVDVLVAVRDWHALLVPLEAGLRMFWTGDSFDQPQNLGLGDRRVSARIDLLCGVSEWHVETLCDASGFPRARARVLPNGIHKPHFDLSETRNRKRLIYSSTPYRGLRHVPPLYLRLREKHPDLELAVFSGYKVYAGADGRGDTRAEKEFEPVKRQIETLPGATLHGNVEQAQLAREFAKSGLLFYPNTFAETSCITAIEAQAAGCPIVTTRLGALPETVGNAGITIPGTPGTSAYDDAFVTAADRILSDAALFETFSKNGRTRAASMGWDDSAAHFERIVGARTK